MSRFVAALPLGFAVLCACAYALIYFPGLMGGDAAFQFVQVRTGAISNLHPPLMVYIWQAMDGVHSDYGWFWLLPLVLFWGGLAILAYQMFTKSSHRFIAIALIGLWPTQLFILSGIWKDSLFVVAMLWTLVACVMRLKKPISMMPWLVLLLAAFIATGMRHNAILALVPLIGWFVFYLSGKWKKAIAVTALVIGCLALTATFLNRTGVAQTSNGPTIWLWDLAAISVAENTMLLPNFTLGEAANGLEGIQREFSPETNTTLCRYIQGKGTTLHCYEDIPYIKGNGLRSEHIALIFHAWWEAVTAYPVSYLYHRANLMCLMLSLCDAHYSSWILTRPFPQHAYYNHWYSGPDVKELGIQIREPSKWGVRLSAGWEWLRLNTPLLSGWVYALNLLVSLVALYRRWRIHRADSIALAMAVNLSGWLILLPLSFIAPNMQPRYLIWPILAGFLSWMLYTAAHVGNGPKRHGQDGHQSAAA